MLAAVLTSGNSDDETVEAVLKVEESLWDGEARDERSDAVTADVGVCGGGLEGEVSSGIIIGGVCGTGGRRRGGRGKAGFVGLEFDSTELCRTISPDCGS